MKTSLQTLLMLACVALATPHVTSAYTHPGGLYTSAQYDFVATRVATNTQPWKMGYDKLIADANAWLTEPPSAVATWTVIDYYTDPNGHAASLAIMMNDAKAAYACALAYRFTGTASYANKARDLINNWASTNTSIAGGSSPLVAASAAVGLVLSAEIIKNYAGWSAADKTQFNTWVTNIFIPKVQSSAPTNNWRDWRNFALLAAYYYTDNTSGVATIVTDVKARIDSHMHSTGYLFDETSRGANSLWYHYYALAPQMASAQIIYNTTGENIFTWTSPGGKSLSTALNYLFTYTQNPGAWPWYTNPNFPNPLLSTSWPLNLFEAMGGVYSNSSYTSFVQSYRPLNGPFNSGAYHHFGWFYPTLMRDVVQFGTGWNLINDDMSNYTAGWGIAGSGGSATQGSGVVTVVDPNAATGWYYLTRNSFTPPTGAFTVEMQARTLGGNASEITVRSGSYGVSLFLTHGTSGQARNRESGPTKTFALNTTIMHTYRLVVDSDYTYDLYVDGVLAWSDSTGTPTGTNILKVGGSGTSGLTANLEVDAVRLGSGMILP